MVSKFSVSWMRLVLAALFSLLLIALSSPVVSAGDPVIAGAGDIACDPANSNFNSGNGTANNCRMKATSDLLVNAGLSGVFILGDNQMEDGAYDKWLASYDPTWGRVKSITHPAVGNHDYLTSGATGYYTYFSSAAGDPSKGYYSYNLGAWHIVVLNSNCSKAGGCGFGSPQEVWLKNDLAANPGKCILGYWHHPRFSSGEWSNHTEYDPFWQDLYAAHADVVMHGHDHDYERFALQNPSGAADALGIREFVAGTGGNNHTPWTTVQPNSQVRNNDTFGVLKLTLHPSSYDWQFVPEAGKTFTDSGTTACHNTASNATPTRTPTAASTAPSGNSLPFVPVADGYADASNPSANYGTATQLRVDSSPVVRSYLQFNIQGVPSGITKATLRVYANSSQSTGFSVYRVANNAWGESSLTYSNAPALGTLIGSSGTATPGTWKSVDVTSYVTGNGTWSFALTTSNSTALSLASRESSSAPQLVIESEPAPAPSLTPTRAPTATPVPSFQPSPPIAAAFFYPWFPDSWTQQGIYPFTNYTPSLGYYSSTDDSIIDQQLKLASQAHLQAMIASWWRQGHYTDSAFAHILARSERSGSPFQNLRWAVYYEQEGSGDPTVDQLVSDLQYLADNYFSHPGYLRVNDRPVIFVYADANDGCGMTDRWAQARQQVNGGEIYLVLKVFPNYGACTSEPESWHQYSPAVGYDIQGNSSVSVSPGFWLKGDDARLARDPVRFESDVKQMMAANTQWWRLITTWNEWGEGTSVEPAQEWDNTYIDILCRNLPGSAPCAPSATATATATRTATPIPAQATPTRTRTPTSTGAPPTATRTATATGIPPTATRTPTVAATPGSFTFKPVADAYVDSANPTTNYGSATQLRVDGSPVVRSYLRFTVQGLSGTISKATLRIYANSSQSSGYAVRRVTANSWTETGITYNNSPAPSSTISGSSGALTSGTWSSVDITALITGNGTFDIALTTAGSTAAGLGSRESGNSPQLVITTR